MKMSTEALPVSLLILLALGLSLVYLFDGANHFDGDEAIVGLMARHTLQGRMPVYFYGQGYLGSLEALVAAGWFALFGPSITTLKLAPLTFYLLFLILQYRLVRCYGGLSAALLTLAFTTVFSPTIIFWSTKARGGFTAVLFWGTLAYLLAFRLIDGIRAGVFRRRDCLPLGIVAGLGFWTCGLVAYYFFPIALYFLGTGAREAGDVLKAGRRIWREGKERRFGWSRWKRRAAGIGFIIIFASLLFSLGVLVRGRIDISVFGLRIRSHSALRDLLRSGGLLIAWLAILFWRGTPKNTWRRIFSRFPSRYPHIAAGAGVFLVYLLISGGINLAFRATPGYEYGHYQTIAPVENLESVGNNISLVFSQLLPTVIGIRPGSSKFGPGAGPLIRQASNLTISALAAAGILTASSLAAALFSRYRRRDLTRNRRLEFFFGLSAGGCLLAMVFTNQARDITAYRYLIPTISWLPFFLVLLIFRTARISKPAGTVLATAVLIGHILKLSPEILHPHPTAPEPALPMILEALQESGLNRVWADYWIAYPITFLTGEEIVAAPYQSQDRYPPYTRAVENAREVAYVFRGESHSPGLNLQSVKDQGRIPVRQDRHPWGYLLLARKDDAP